MRENQDKLGTATELPPQRVDLSEELRKHLQQVLESYGVPYRSLEVFCDEKLQVLVYLTWDRDGNLRMTYSDLIEFMKPEEREILLRSEVEHCHRCLTRLANSATQQR